MCTIFIPNAETQVRFNDSSEKSFTLSFDYWSTDRKAIDTQIEYQVDKGGAWTINSLKHLIAAHQTTGRIGVPNKPENISIFDTSSVSKLICWNWW